LNKSEADFGQRSAIEGKDGDGLINPTVRDSADFGNASQYLPMDKSIVGLATPLP